MKQMTYVLLFFLFMSVHACAPTDAERNQTQTAVIAASDARKTASAATKSAEPTRTPAPPVPTSTKDTRSPFERCRNSGNGIRYVISVTSGSVSAVSLTLENDSSGTEQGDFKVPYCRPFNGFQSGDFLYISAQIIRPTSGAGTINCEIWDDNNRISTAQASGFPSIATCSESAR